MGGDYLRGQSMEIPAEESRWFFLRFHWVRTARIARSLEGAGLGLALAKPFAEMHGQTLRSSHLMEITGRLEWRLEGDQPGDQP